MHVEIRTIRDGADHLEGVLRLVESKVVAEPESPLLRNLLEEPAFDRQTNQLYDAASNPKEFLRSLHLQYRSAYLRASKAKEDEDQ